MPAPLTPVDQLLQNIQTYEEFLSAYIQLDQSQSGLLWVKADVIAEMQQRLGFSSMKALAYDVKQPPSTVVNYARTAKAFPSESRDENVSFTLHYQASLADSYDSKTGKFDGNKRFEMLNRAISENMSTRQLAETIQAEKNPQIPETVDPEYQIARDKVARIKAKLSELLDNIKNNENKTTNLDTLENIYSASYG